MSLALSLHPSIRSTGAALWRIEDRALIAAALIPNPAKRGVGPSECASAAQAVDAWIAEKKVLLREPFGHVSSKEQLRELLEQFTVTEIALDCALSGAAVVGVTSALLALYYPAELRGSLGEAMSPARLRGVLSADELLRVEQDHRAAWRAIDVGLRVLGRLEPAPAGEVRA